MALFSTPTRTLAPISTAGPAPSACAGWKSRQSLWLVALLTAFVWSYWPTLHHLADTWNREPDYSHGYLVLPLFTCFLWLRRNQFPIHLRPSWFGFVLLVLSISLRIAGGRFFLGPLDGWSIVVWCAGVAMCLGGWDLLRWSLAPILFLLFMVPLPYRCEFLVSEPLQQMAAALSSFLLQCLGQPAFAEETALLLRDRVLQVEQACSGLRIFVGILALACGYLIAIRREAWEAVLLILSVAPVALMANSMRIVVTALLFQYSSDEAAQHFSHDIAGWLMIPIAAGMLAFVQWYLSCLMREVAPSQLSDLVRRHQVHAVRPT